VLKAAAGAAARNLPSAALDGALGWTTAAVGPKKRRARVGTKLRRRLERAACDDPMALYRGGVRRWGDVAELVPGAPSLETVFERDLSLDTLGNVADRAMVVDALGYLPEE